MRKLTYLLFSFPCFYLLSCNTIKIDDDIYEDREHFRIETRTATYLFDKAGGGLARVFDNDGIDWVHYNGDPYAVFPSGASGGFRGIPNSVFRSDDGGASHPGFDQCISEIEGDNKIRTRSKSGKWEWLWEFFNDHARVSVLSVDPNPPYWFL